MACRLMKNILALIVSLVIAIVYLPLISVEARVDKRSTLPMSDPDIIPVSSRVGRVMVAAGGDVTAGLKVDGTVVAAGVSDEINEIISTWRGIVEISVSDNHIAALDKNGKVFTAGIEENVASQIALWTDVVSISSGGFNRVVGINKDGKLLYPVSNEFHPIEPNYFNSWSNAAMVSVSSYHVAYLRALSGVTDSSRDAGVLKMPSPNTGYAAISAGASRQVIPGSGGTTTHVGYTVGLKKNGDVDVVFQEGANTDMGQSEADEWEGIVAIAAGDEHVLGLNESGTVNVAGNVSEYHKLLIESWSNIDMVAAGRTHSIGLKADGRVSYAGDYSPNKDIVESWSLNSISDYIITPSEESGTEFQRTFMLGFDYPDSTALFYTLDNTDPKNMSERYRDIPVAVKKTTVVRAVLYAEGVFGREFTFSYSIVPVVSASPGTGNYINPLTVIPTSGFEDGRFYFRRAYSGAGVSDEMDDSAYWYNPATGIEIAPKPGRNVVTLLIGVVHINDLNTSIASATFTYTFPQVNVRVTEKSAGITDTNDMIDYVKKISYVDVTLECLDEKKIGLDYKLYYIVNANASDTHMNARAYTGPFTIGESVDENGIATLDVWVKFDDSNKYNPVKYRRIVYDFSQMPYAYVVSDGNESISHKDPFFILLSMDSGWRSLYDIYYTTDGSDPRGKHSIKHDNQPLTIYHTTTLKLVPKLRSNTDIAGRVTSYTYIFPDKHEAGIYKTFDRNNNEVYVGIKYVTHTANRVQTTYVTNLAFYDTDGRLIGMGGSSIKPFEYGVTEEIGITYAPDFALSGDIIAKMITWDINMNPYDAPLIQSVSDMKSITMP